MKGIKGTPRGVNTSEFALTALTIAAIVALSAFGIVLDPAIIAILMGGVSSYGAVRTWAKRPARDQERLELLAANVDKLLASALESHRRRNQGSR